MNEHGLYKFVERDSGEIIYIGKTNSSFKNRIDAHIRATDADFKFKNYINKCDIYIAELPNRTETDLLERALINKYKPILNGTDNYKGMSTFIKVDEPKWVIYKDVRAKKISKNKNQKSKPKNDDWNSLVYDYVFTLEDIDYGVYICRLKDSCLFSSSFEALDFFRNLVTVCNKYGKEDRGYIRVSGKHLYKYAILKKIYEIDELLELALLIRPNPTSDFFDSDLRGKPYFVARDKEVEIISAYEKPKIKNIWFNLSLIELLSEYLK